MVKGGVVRALPQSSHHQIVALQPRHSTNERSASYSTPLTFDTTHAYDAYLFNFGPSVQRVAKRESYSSTLAKPRTLMRSISFTPAFPWRAFPLPFAPPRKPGRMRSMHVRRAVGDALGYNPFYVPSAVRHVQSTHCLTLLLSAAASTPRVT